MKLTLTITDASPSEIANIASLLGGTAPFSVSAEQFVVAAPADDSDDDNVPAATITPGETDVTGLPYDERIHSGARTKNADGRWKKRKGVDDATVTAVEAELRSGNAAASASGAAPTPPVSAPATAPAPAEPPVTSAPPSAPIAAPPAPAAPPAAPAPAGALDFGGLMQIVSNGMTANPPLINDEWLAYLCGQVGVQQLPEIANDPAKIKQVYDLIKQHLPAMNLA